MSETTRKNFSLGNKMNKTSQNKLFFPNFSMKNKYILLLLCGTLSFSIEL